MYGISDYQTWANEKFHINNRNSPRTNHRQIWLAKLGANIGCEENGKGGFLRPVLVVRNIGSLVFIVPLTTQQKNNQYLYSLQSIDFFDKLKNPIQSQLILSQARTLDPKRLISYMGSISPDEYLTIKKHLRDMYLPGV